MVYGAYPPERCEIHKKKKYFCNERGRDVEFDVVVEVRGEGRTEPQLFVVFECKNHESPVQERDITDFSDKLERIFRHAAKGIVVTKSRLQSGADAIATNRRLGIAKFDATGIDVLADRMGGSWTEAPFVQRQMYADPRISKALKFSALRNAKYYSTFQELLSALCAEAEGIEVQKGSKQPAAVPFLPEKDIRKAAERALAKINYEDQRVDLLALCSAMNLTVSHSNYEVADAADNPILGTANFSTRSIQINRHGNPNRERFTLAHEIGHFYLGHDTLLKSETLVKQDLFTGLSDEVEFNYARLETQANLFASYLLMPESQFFNGVSALRQQLRMNDKGFGYIFVDDQECNYRPYNQILAALSDYFGVSKKAAEIRLKRAGRVTDKRSSFALGRILGATSFNL